MKRYVSRTVSAIFDGYGNLDVMSTWTPWNSWSGAFSFSRLDYCNAVLYGLPQLSSLYTASIMPLRGSQSSSRRVTTSARHWRSCTDWVIRRRQYREALLMFTVPSDHCPLYLKTIRRVCQQWSSSSKSSFLCRFWLGRHCFTDQNKVRRLSFLLLPVRKIGTVCLSLPGLRTLLTILSATWTNVF